MLKPFILCICVLLCIVQSPLASSEAHTSILTLPTQLPLAFPTITTPYPPPPLPFEVDTVVTESSLWNSLLHGSLHGVHIDSLDLNGHFAARGTYKNLPLLNGIELQDGITFSSGPTLDLVPAGSGGPEDLGYPGDPNILAYATAGSNSSYDAMLFTVHFTVPIAVKQLSFELAFTSSEFPAYVGTEFNDVFIALLDGTNISFDENGNALTVNNDYFLIDDQANLIPAGYAGFTPALKTVAFLTPGKHTLTFAIGDIGDATFNSAIFLSSFQFHTDTASIGTGIIKKEQLIRVLDKSPGGTILDTILHTTTGVQHLSFLSPTQDFIVDSLSGAISVSPGVTMDYVTTPEYLDTVLAHYTSYIDTIPIKIIVIPIGTLLPKQFFVVDDQSPAGTVVDTIEFNSTNVNSLTLLTAEPAIFLDPITGVLTVANAITLDRSIDSLYQNSVILQYDLYSDTIPIAITVKKPGVLLDTLRFSIDDKTPGGSLIDTITVASTGVTKFSLMNPSSKLIIDSITGALFVNDTITVNRKNDTAYTPFILVNYGIYQDTLPVIVSILRISERLEEQLFTVHENAHDGAIIGTVALEQHGLLSAILQTPSTDIAFAQNDAQLIVKINGTIDKDIIPLYANTILLEYQNYTDTIPIIITVIKNIYYMPHAIDASLYDADGNGHADSIAVIFEKKTVSEEVLTSISLHLSNGDTIIIPPFKYTTHTIDDMYTTLFIELSHPVATTRISGIITFTYTADDSTQYQSIPIKDALGPVVISAILNTHPQWNSPRLNLHFSEPIIGYDSIPDGYFLINETPIAIQELLIHTDSTWQFIIDSTIIKQGDTLRFIPHKYAADTLNNTAHAFNKAVLIEHSELFSVRRTGHAYHDLDSNGTLDALTVSFNKPLNDFLLNHLTIQFSWLDVAAQPIGVPVQREWISPHALDSSIALISIPPTTSLKPFSTNPPTQESDVITISFALPHNAAESYTVPIIDSMAPIISRAQLSHTGSGASDFSIFSDTLIVHFSEPIDTNQLAFEGIVSLYRYSLLSSFNPTAILWEDSTTLTLPLASSSVRVIAPGDSVSITQIADGILDFSGNNGAATKRVIEGNISLGIQATPMGRYTTPVDGGPSLIVEQVDSYRPLNEIMNEKGRGGVGIIIEGPKAPGGALVDLDPLYTFQISVFSTTGQYINHFGGAFVLCSHRVDPAQQCVSDNQSLFLNWNMRTAQDRKVASGVYLIDYRINNSGTEQRGMISVGIKRDN